MRSLPSSLHDDVASQLRNYIFDGQLSPGSFIDEVTLCELWSISRTPLREALKVLTAEGLVRHEPRRGCFVNEVTEQDLDDIFPVIAMLEGRCAFDATQRATPADVQALEVWHQRLKQAASTITTKPISPFTKPSFSWPTTNGWHKPLPIYARF